MTSGRTVIVGGGIAGLAAARVLAADGRDVVVVERSRMWRPTGAALTLARNAMAVLDDLGAGRAVRAVGRRIDGAVIADAGGTPLGAVSEGWPELYAIRRADLHDCLRRFHGFGGPAGRALADLDGRTEILRNDIVELDGVAFGSGRVALVGDAAHARPPTSARAPVRPWRTSPCSRTRSEPCR